MLLAVRTSSYRCTWEVWRALKEARVARLRLEQLLRFSRALQSSRVHPQLDVRTLKHEPIVKQTLQRVRQTNRVIQT